MFLLILALVFHADLELRTVEGVDNFYCELRSRHLVKYNLAQDEVKFVVDCAVLFHDGFE